MTLATRCPTCGTVFRVVQDQLRVSHGWVRCGRCNQAFNALESMVEVPTVLAPDPQAGPSPEPFPPTEFGPTAVMEWPDTTNIAEAEPRPVAPMASRTTLPARAGTAVAPPAGSAARATPEVDAAYVTDDPPAAGSPGPGSLLDLPIGLNLIASDGAVQPAPPATIAHERTEPVYDVVDDAPAPVDVLNPDPAPSDVAAEPFLVMAQATPAATQAPMAVAASMDEAVAAAPERAPSFVVRAERAERWRRPWVRALLSALALVGTIALAGQVTYTFRDRIVAAAPSLRPVLQQACATLGCTVGEYRQIDALSVESSGLVRVEGAPVYRLAVTLRNRAGVEVAAPALDLSLTDAQGKPIARRVLQMSDLYLPLRTLKPGSELPIQVSLGIGDRPVSGYTVEIFYP
ncbi:MAG: hypothetical protein RJA10_1652 [Pseudomonadota bacterium]|jgi:predicted Zn finger-like uncharacterized protein